MKYWNSIELRKLVGSIDRGPMSRNEEEEWIRNTWKLRTERKAFIFAIESIADGKLIVMAEKGKLVIAEAVPDGYKAISEASILSPRCWTVPVLANGRIYVRNAKGDLVCLDVSK